MLPGKLKGINIGMSVTKNTQIRIAVLKSMAKIIKFNSPKSVDVYVLQHLIRPVVITTPAKNWKPPITTSSIYAYPEAVEMVTSKFDFSD